MTENAIPAAIAGKFRRDHYQQNAGWYHDELESCSRKNVWLPGTEAIGKRHISLIIPPDRLDEEKLIISQIKAGKKVNHFETVRLTGSARRAYFR